jgi:hypothetical protein
MRQNVEVDIHNSRRIDQDNREYLTILNHP